jgi:hypothetical protein
MNQIEKYFRAEKAESLLFMVVGLLAITLSLYFNFKQKDFFYTGMSYALLAVAILQLVVGFTVYKRSPLDETRVKSMIEVQFDKIENEEIPRMQLVMKNFVVYRWVEIVLAIIGILHYLFLGRTEWLKGFGLGLSLQSVLMLLLDFFAEHRGQIYLKFLNDFIQKS